jgi:hypothetical protein
VVIPDWWIFAESLEAELKPKAIDRAYSPR